jgi:hypothetical protein
MCSECAAIVQRLRSDVESTVQLLRSDCAALSQPLRSDRAAISKGKQSRMIFFFDEGHHSYQKQSWLAAFRTPKAGTKYITSQRRK